jgi:hypothetical protein
MEQVTFVIDNKEDANLLISIAEKIGIKKHIVSKTAHRESKRKKLYEIIDAGVDVSNFGDPSLWQRETRKDRILTKRP